MVQLLTVRFHVLLVLQTSNAFSAIGFPTIHPRIQLLQSHARIIGEKEPG